MAKVTQVDIDAKRDPVGTLGLVRGSKAYKTAVSKKKTKGNTQGSGSVASQIQQAIAAAAQTGQNQQPIGVEPTFRATPRMQPGQEIAGAYGPIQTIAPKYFAGMEDGAGVQGFPTTTQGINQLQKSLVAGQLLKQGSYVPGQWDDVSAKAYANVLAEANKNGIDWTEALGKRLTAASKGELLTQAATRRNPLVIKLTAPEDIQAAAQQATKTLHNTYMSPAELAQFTKAYQQQEAAFQTASYESTGFDPLTGQADTSGFDAGTDAQGNPLPAAQGTTLTAPPTGAGLEQAITRKTIEEHPNEFAANTFTDRLNEILGGLQSPFHNAEQVGPL